MLIDRSKIKAVLIDDMIQVKHGDHFLFALVKESTENDIQRAITIFMIGYIHGKNL